MGGVGYFGAPSSFHACCMTKSQGTHPSLPSARKVKRDSALIMNTNVANARNASTQ